MLKNSQIRKWHRDLGYFFVGLIIAFCASGIAQNHRRSWDPEEYVYSSREVNTRLDTIPTGKINDALVKKMLTENGVDLPLRGFKTEDDPKALKIFFENGNLYIDLTTGKGRLEFMKTRPVIGYLSILHKSANHFWIWYSDIFALGLITIASLGIVMAKGKYGFRQRGYKIMLAGIIAPLITLLFFSL